MLVKGVEIAVDTFGDPADPAILLIMGVGGSMDWWEPEFCAGLAAGGRRVIRYDHRDSQPTTLYQAFTSENSRGDVWRGGIR